MKKSRHIGKKIEWLFREFRSYLSLENFRTYKQLKNKVSLKLQAEQRKLALFDLRSIAIDSDAGRYLYHIVQDFIALGYTPCYKNNYRFVANIKTKGFKKYLLSTDYIFYTHEAQLSKYGDINICISDCAKALHLTNCAHSILLDYDIRFAKQGELALTFGPSPTLLNEHLFQVKINVHSPRLNRIFFAGRTRKAEYDRDLLEKNYGIMSRAQMFRVAAEYPHNDKLIPNEQLQCIEWTKPHDILLVSNDHCKIPPNQWMKLMGQSDFFLACPGSEMPLCHNLIECLAAGTIPILEYPQYLKPGLIHGINCLSFTGASGLHNCLKDALEMPLEQIMTMRQAALTFYQENYSSGKLAEKLIKAHNTTLVMSDFRMKI